MTRHVDLCIMMLRYDARMRTTVSINDDLLRRARIVAVESGRSLGDVVDDALRVLLSSSATRRNCATVELVAYGGSGLVPGVDLEDKDALALILGDEGRPGADR